MQIASEVKSQPSPSSKATRLKQIRQWHLYLGTLFAPTILFFALTGALQIFNLHEGRPGGTYQPPAWIVKVASVHKNQTLPVRRNTPPAAAAAQPDPAAATRRAPQPAGPRREERRPPSVFTYLLKWFFVFASLGLVWTTCLGIYMSFKFNRSRALVWSLLAAGTAIPASLLLFMALAK